jgi:hypothetical protein
MPWVPVSFFLVGLKRMYFLSFWQTTRYISVFFTGAGKRAGFFRNIGVPLREKELVSGLLALMVLAHYPRVSGEEQTRENIASSLHPHRAATTQW